MTASSDPRLPKDPALYRARPLLGAPFWALLALCVLSVLAGVGVATLGPRIWPAPPPPAAPPGPVQSPPPPPAPAATAVVPPGEPDDLAQLNARIAELETHGARSDQAAAAALAAAVLMDAAQGSRPFARELAALRVAAPDLPELAALTETAATGAPSAPALAASFDDYAGRAAAYARKPSASDGLGSRVVYNLSKVISLRRVGEVGGSGPDALIAQAELALREGDVVGAVALVDRLPERARRHLAPWREGARRRAEVDRLLDGLRGRAAEALAQPGGAA